MTRRTVLVVEDDRAIRRGLVDALECGGFGALECADGPSGLRTALGADPDLVLLDLLLPGRDGFSVLEELRRARPALPVILITARGGEADRVRGLRSGADDYVVKPFSALELLARVEAVLRRSAERPRGVSSLRCGDATVDLDRREVRRGGAPIPLSEREAELLRYLAASPGRVIARQEILERVWGLPSGRAETRTIDMHVARLREKLGDDPRNPTIILTVRARGYLFPGEGP
jgi:DNA-binding response OmpR family regulator